MGFFSDLKEDLAQAVSELMPEEEQIRAGGEQEISIDEMLENIEDVELPQELSGQPDADDKADEKQPEEDDKADGKQPEADGEAVWEQPEEDDKAAWEQPEADGEAAWEQPNADGESDWPRPATELWPDGEIPKEVDEQEMRRMLEEILEQSPEAEEKATAADTQRNEIKDTEGGMEMDTVREVADETAVITAGMVITGDISTEGSIDVIGTINGNVDALGKLNITGRIVGNSKAAEIYAESAKINGEVVSEGAVKIGASAVIIGNITAASAAIAGAVKGDIDVKGPVILDTSAIVMGNIKSKSVQINNGAVIEGMCSQCYADVSPTSFFEEYKPEMRKARVK